jgi:hypothetical protein
MPADSKQGEVDFTKAKQFHFYKFTIAPNQKGKVTIGFKINLPARGSKVACYLMRTPDEEGEKITGTSLTRALDPGDYYLRVQAPEQGEFAKYALTNSFLADNFITADVLEKGINPCMLTINAGSNKGVRTGAAATIMSAPNSPVDSAVVDQVFQNLAKVRPLGNSCAKIPANGATVVIQAQ